jgi:hypothetical protein
VNIAPVSPLLPGGISAMSLEDAQTLARRAHTCRWLLKICRLCAALPFDGLPPSAAKALAPNAFHEILLDLYLAEHEGRRVYQSYLAGSGPPWKTHRQVARLETLGLVSRSRDPTDHRRLNVTLALDLRRLLDDAMDALEQSGRQHFRDGPESRD